MRKLPEEVWHLIFQYLSGRDLINLTRVCILFRDIVNTSPSLASKLTIRFRKRMRNGRLGRRKYTRLSVEYIDESVHYNVLRFIGNDITHLKFSFYNFKLESIRKVLMLCSKVKYLSFQQIQHFHGVQDVNTVKIPNYNDLDVSVEQCDPRVFKILKNCQAKRVHMTCCDFAHRHYFLDFLSFLRDQEALDELSFEDFIGPCVGLGLVLFQNDALTHAKFKLKSLILKSNQLSPYGNISSLQFFETFMSLHTDSLEMLEADQLHDFEFTSYLQQCKNIKKINVGIDMRLSSQQFLPNVSQIEVEHPRMNLLRCFPNLRELSLLNTYYDPIPENNIVKWNLLTQCQYLEELELDDLSLDDFPSMPSLKCLTLKSYVSIDSDIFARNPQIENVTFIECRDMRTRNGKVLKIIVDYLKDLRNLTIVSEYKVDQSALAYVKQKCLKLKYLRVYKDIETSLMWGY